MEQDEIGEKYIGNTNCIYSVLCLKLDVMDANYYNLYYFLCLLIYFKIYNTLAHTKHRYYYSLQMVFIENYIFVEKEQTFIGKYKKKK